MLLAVPSGGEEHWLADIVREKILDNLQALWALHSRMHQSPALRDVAHMHNQSHNNYYNIIIKQPFIWWVPTSRNTEKGNSAHTKIVFV